MALLKEAIGILVGGIVDAGTGIASGINQVVTSLFIKSGVETASLSVFGEMVFIFGGIALALGLTRWVLNFLTSLGNRNR